MSDPIYPVYISVPWYLSGSGGPNEVDLIRSLECIVETYKKNVTAPDAEIARAVNWLHAKYGGAE